MSTTFTTDGDINILLILYVQLLTRRKGSVSCGSKVARIRSVIYYSVAIGLR